MVTVAVGAGVFLAIGVTVPLLPRYVEGTLGGGGVAVGVVAGAFALSAVVTRPWAGRLGDVRGRRVPIRLGALCVAVSVAASGLAPGIAPLIGLRLLTGVGQALFFTGAITLVNDLAPANRRGEAVSYFSVAVYAGMGLGPVIGETVADRAGTSWGFAAGGLLALAAAVVARAAPNPAAPPRPADAAPRRLVHPDALGPGLVLMLGLMGFAGFQAFAPLYVEDLDGVTASTVFLLYAAVVLVVRVAGARIPDRFGARPTALVALVLIAAGLSVVVAWATPAGLLCGVVVLGLGMALQYPAMLSLAVADTPAHDRGAVLGTFTGFFDLASGIGGPLMGAAAAVGGERGAFATGAATAALGFVVLLAGPGRPSRGPAPAPAPAPPPAP